MRVKVFTAATVQEAMNQVKSELGIDAVILHTKKFYKGGFFGYMGKEMVEVTAAVDDKPKIVKAKPPLKEPIIPKKVVNNYTKNTVLESGNDINRIGPNQFRPNELQNNIVKNNAFNSDLEEKQAEKIFELQQELDSMKIMLEKVMTESANNKIITKSLIDALRENEVEDKVAQEIIADICDEDILLNKDAVKTKNVLSDCFVKKFHAAKEIEIPDTGTKIVALIGTTGVGKTTTIAKLAANFVLEKGCSVALITADTYRISAVEQLKTYSDIIGLPLEIVYSPSELKAAINKHSDKQLILIDTAGRSQHNDFQLDELQNLLAVADDIEKHLVLSATTKYKDAVDIFRKFSLCSPNRVLFTKIDETSTIGGVINLIYHYPIALSYFTNGQSVPDDISLADSSKLAELILR